MRAILLTILVSTFLFWLTDSSLAQIVQPPEQNHILTAKDASALVADALSRAGAGDEIKVSLTGMQDEDALAVAAKPIHADIDGLDLDKAHNRWQAVLIIEADGKNLAPVKLSGRYDEMAQVPMLKRQLQAGDVISEDDIEWNREPVQHLRKNTITETSELIGKSPRRVISQGRAIRREEIASPAIINKGARITIYYKSRNLEIKTLGEAIDSGAKGDVIRVKNVASKSIIQGTVESSDLVRVTSPDSTSAEAM